MRLLWVAIAKKETLMTLAEHWNSRYEAGTTPWDSGLASRELRLRIEEQKLAPCRVLELGCGSGTNAVFLAELGFDVTATDCSDVALAKGKTLAQQRGVRVNWICGDVCELDFGEPFPFVFDRGCFHCCRRERMPILPALERATTAGSKMLVLTGNANEERDHGPPQLTEAELREELDGLFTIDSLREFYFEDPGGVQGPLGWSCWMTRR